MSRVFADRCNLPDDEAVDDFGFVVDCSVPFAPGPIRDCPTSGFEFPILIPSSGGDGSGYQGFQGEPGTAGSDGEPGTTGSQGFQGLAGSQGFQGVAGATGATGETGSQGSQGFQGATGSTGEAGATGAQGFQGFQGFQGVSGNPCDSEATVETEFVSNVCPIYEDVPALVWRGEWVDGDSYIAEDVVYYGGSSYVCIQDNTGEDIGNTDYWELLAIAGSQGFQGFQGAAGAAGSTGAQGFQGFQGDTGATGSTGGTGAQGFQGYQGAAGATGSTGSTGAQGFQGYQGDTGAGGATGAQGFQGFQGFQGATGAQGFQGYQGATGSIDINSLTLTELALGDESPWYDISASAIRKVTAERVLGFNALIPGGRLSLTSGNPHDVSDVAGAGTLYYTFFAHDKLRLYEGSQWVLHTIPNNISLALSVTAGAIRDVFIYDNAGTITLALSASWSDTVTRTTALALQDGVWVRSGTPTQLWLGTIYATGTNVCDDSSATYRGVWNAYNRVRKPIKVLDATNSWTYSTASYRQMNNSAANQIGIICGMAGASMLSLTGSYTMASSVVGANFGAIGEDSTTVPESNSHPAYLYVTAANQVASNPAIMNKCPALGYHYYAAMERGLGSGTQTWYGDNGAPTLIQSGLRGFWEC